MEISIKKLISIFFKRIWIIIICAILFAAGVYSYSRFVVEPQYVSTVKFYVTPKSVDEAGSTISASVSQLNYVQEISETYIGILDTYDFCKIVQEDCEIRSINFIRSCSSYTSIKDTSLFQLAVTTNSIEDSFMIAQSIEKLAPRRIEDKTSSGWIDVQVVESAKRASAASNAGYTAKALFGAFLGAVLSYVIILIFEFSDVRIKSAEDLTRDYDIPILGIVPDFEDTGKSNSKERYYKYEKYEKSTPKQ